MSTKLPNVRRAVRHSQNILSLFCSTVLLLSHKVFRSREGSQRKYSVTILRQCVTTIYCGVQNYSVSGFIIFELFTVIFCQDWAGWGIFTVIPGNPRRTKGDSQHLEARPELQDWLRSELFTVKNSRTGPFSNYLGNNFELYSNFLHYIQYRIPKYFNL